MVVLKNRAAPRHVVLPALHYSMIKHPPTTYYSFYPSTDENEVVIRKIAAEPIMSSTDYLAVTSEHQTIIRFRVYSRIN